MLEKTEGAIENGQSRETCSIGYTRHKRQTSKTKNTTHYVFFSPNTNNLNKTSDLIQTTGGKDEPNIVFIRKYGFLFNNVPFLFKFGSE
jgi:hypothetical protein